LDPIFRLLEDEQNYFYKKEAGGGKRVRASLGMGLKQIRLP